MSEYKEVYSFEYPLSKTYQGDVEVNFSEIAIPLDRFMRRGAKILEVKIFVGDPAVAGNHFRIQVTYTKPGGHWWEI